MIFLTFIEITDDVCDSQLLMLCFIFHCTPLLLLYLLATTADRFKVCSLEKITIASTPIKDNFPLQLMLFLCIIATNYTRIFQQNFPRFIFQNNKQRENWGNFIFTDE